MVKKNMTCALYLLITTTVNADVGLSDPTRPADYSVAISAKQVAPQKRTEFNLNAIRISNEDRSAIVNGRLVRVGDDIGTAKVREINKQDVVLDYERKQLTIPLYAQGVTKDYKTPTGEN